jgi:hypothetical protein
MARRGRTPNEPRALVAAATRIRLDDRRLAKKQGARRQEWQNDAWEYFDLFGFVKQAIWLQANSLAKARLYPAVANPDDPDGEPIPVDDPTSPVPPDVAAQCKAELARLTGPLGGLPEILREMNMNLEVPGEGYLVGYGARDEQVNERTMEVEREAHPESWQVRSTSEVTITGDGVYKVHDDPSDKRGTSLDPEYDTCIRFWIPHPRYSNIPDSPMRGELEDFETLLILTRQRRGEGKSRLPGGLLLIDSQITATSPVKSDQDNGTNSSTGDIVLDAIADAISDAIEDESSAAGLAPVMLRVNVPPGSDVSKMVAKVDMSRTSDQWLDGRVQALVESVSRGLNLPIESVMGHQQTTFANAEQVNDDKFYDHTEPRLLLICDLLTCAFLRPQLLAPDAAGRAAPPQFEQWAPQIFVWYDASAIVGKPDRAAGANEAHGNLTISDSAYRAARGFSEDDAPEPLELLIRSGLRRGILTADLTKGLLDLLGVPFEVEATPNAVGGDVPTEATSTYRELAALLLAQHQAQQADDVIDVDATTAAAMTLDELTDSFVRSPPTVNGNGNGQAAIAPAVLERVVERNPGRTLMDIDRDLRTKLLVLCSTAMSRALERAGNRAKNALPQAKVLVRNVSPTLVCATLGPSIIAAGGLDDSALLDGAFDEIEDQYMRWGASAQREALDLAADLGSGLSTAQRDAYGLRQADDLAEGWQWLKEQLTTQAQARMFDPTPTAPPLGEFDPDLNVPPGMIRQSITRAGGTIGVETKGAGDAFVSLRNGGEPAGGIGTGEVIRDAIGATGSSVEAYQWVYGPAMRKHPFEPHVALDGLVFRNFDDDVLANNDGFPDYGYFFPGDHAGCICDFEPIVVDASELAADDETLVAIEQEA